MRSLPFTSWGDERRVLGARAPTKVFGRNFTMGGHPQSFGRKVRGNGNFR